MDGHKENINLHSIDILVLANERFVKDMPLPQEVNERHTTAYVYLACVFCVRAIRACVCESVSMYSVHVCFVCIHSFIHIKPLYSVPSRKQLRGARGACIPSTYWLEGNIKLI